MQILMPWLYHESETLDYDRLPSYVHAADLESLFV